MQLSYRQIRDTQSNSKMKFSSACVCVRKCVRDRKNPLMTKFSIMFSWLMCFSVSAGFTATSFAVTGFPAASFPITDFAVTDFTATGLPAASLLATNFATTDLDSAILVTNTNNDDKAKRFYDNVMNAPAILPAKIEHQFISCPVIHKEASQQKGLEQKTSRDKTLDGFYQTSQQVDYLQAEWEKRISADWTFFQASQTAGKILVIDFKQTSDGLAYRYLANDNTHNQLYEPWSSSKVLAFTAAVSKARQKSNGKVGAMSRAGEHPLADLITSINSYEVFGKADGNSNAIATYFLNLVGRDQATALFHQDWLKLSNPLIRFRGAYERELFIPTDSYWAVQTTNNKIAMPPLEKNRDDAGYQEYRCEECGLTGNKPMTTLAEAEWLKRLAAHERDEQTRMPALKNEDVKVLFYGTGHSDKTQKVGGMMLGISAMLQHALANAISQTTSENIISASTETAMSASTEKALSASTDLANSKLILDSATNGEWRVWQKIGWGPSETRGTGENVVLAHVCLPHFQGGREFTVAAIASSPARNPTPDELDVGYAGLKMQILLDQSIAKLLAPKKD